MATKSVAFLTLLVATTMTVKALRIDDEEDAAPRRTFETGEMLAPGAEPMPIDDDTMTLLEADPPPAEGMPSEDAQRLSDEAQGEGQDAATAAAPQQEDEDKEESTAEEAEKTNSGVLQKNMKQASQKAYEDANCSAPGVPLPSDETPAGLPTTFETLESTKSVLKVKTEEQVAQLKGEVTEKTEKRVAKQAYQAHERKTQAATAARETIIAPGAAAAGDVTQAAAPTEQEEQVVEQAAEEEATTEAAATTAPEASATEAADVQEEAPVEAANSLQENEPVQEDEEISEEATDEAADGEVPEGGEEEIRAGIHEDALTRYSKVAAERYIHGAESVTKESVERAKSTAMHVVELRAEAKARKEAAWREDQAEEISDGELQHHISVLKDHQGAWTKWTNPDTAVA